MNTSPKGIGFSPKKKEPHLWVADKKKYIRALAGHLRELREAAGITQGEISDIIGIKRQTYGPIERQKREMSWATYMSLMFYYDHNPNTHRMLHTWGLCPPELDGSTAYLRANREGEKPIRNGDLSEEIRTNAP